MPAIKAPKASDSPACSVKYASPSVIKSRLSMNSSSLFRRATSVSHQRMIFCPPVNRMAIKNVALSEAMPSE